MSYFDGFLAGAGEANQISRPFSFWSPARGGLLVFALLLFPSGLVVKSRLSVDGSIREVVLVGLVLLSQELLGYDQILSQVTQQENIPKELCIPTPEHRKKVLCLRQLQMTERLDFLLCPMKLKIKKQSFIKSFLPWSQVSNQ